MPLAKFELALVTEVQEEALPPQTECAVWREHVAALLHSEVLHRECQHGRQQPGHGAKAESGEDTNSQHELDEEPPRVQTALVKIASGVAKE